MYLLSRFLMLTTLPAPFPFPLLLWRNDGQQAALGVNKTWETCNYAVNARFDADWVHSFSDDVAYVLSKGHKVRVGFQRGGG